MCNLKDPIVIVNISGNTFGFPSGTVPDETVYNYLGIPYLTSYPHITYISNINSATIPVEINSIRCNATFAISNPLFQGMYIKSLGTHILIGYESEVEKLKDFASYVIGYRNNDSSIAETRVLIAQTVLSEIDKRKRHNFRDDVLELLGLPLDTKSRIEESNKLAAKIASLELELDKSRKLISDLKSLLQNA